MLRESQDGCQRRLQKALDSFTFSWTLRNSPQLQVRVINTAPLPPPFHLPPHFRSLPRPHLPPPSLPPNDFLCQRPPSPNHLLCQRRTLLPLVSMLETLSFSCKVSQPPILNLSIIPQCPRQHRSSRNMV